MSYQYPIHFAVDISELAASTKFTLIAECRFKKIELNSVYLDKKKSDTFLSSDDADRKIRELLMTSGLVDTPEPP